MVDIPQTNTASSDASTDTEGLFDSNGLATRKATVTAYGYDQNSGLLLGPETQTVQAGVSLAANSTMTPPPETQKGQVAVFNTDTKGWVIQVDLRGTVVYRKTDGVQGTFGQIGPLTSDVVTVAPPGPYCAWDDSKEEWVVNVPARQDHLQQLAQYWMGVYSQARNANGWDGIVQEVPADVLTFAKALVPFLKKEDATSTDIPAVPAELTNFLNQQQGQNQQSSNS